MPIKMNTKTSNSFTVTLQSNFCKDDYPHNTNYKFTNKLPHLLSVKDYEVGLVDLYYYDQYVRPQNQDQDPNARLNQDNVPFFDTLLFDNEITIQTSGGARMQVLKDTDSFLNFLAGLNFALTKFNMGVHFSLNMQRGVPIQVILEFKNDFGWKLGIPETLCKVLGFEKCVFESGRYEGERNIDLELFKTIPNGLVGILTTEIYQRKDVKLPQFRGKPRLSLLINNIVSLLLENDMDVSMYLDSARGPYVYYEIQDENRVTLSKFLNNYLGLPDNFYFEGEGSIVVPESIIDPASHERFLFEELQRSTPSSKVLVLTNIIGPQYFANNEYPILAVLNRVGRSAGSEIIHRINPIVYKRINLTKISEIEISLLSDTGETTSFSRNPTNLTLHFRKIKNEGYNL